jgi:CRP/FNR family cyclic AMP-dependent transcriptional regulator
MAEFQDKNIIAVQRRVVTVTNRAALEARARPRL